MWPRSKSFIICLLTFLVLAVINFEKMRQADYTFLRLSTDRLMKIDDASDENLTSWIQDYATWHRKIVNSLDLDNWNDHKYLILYCPPQGGCAGASDRLQPAVLLLRMAQQSNRLFFIHWEHPYPLEEFLIPTGFLNWTMPNWLVHATNLESLPMYSEANNISDYDNHTAITARLKLGHEGTVKMYDRMEGNGTFAQIYSAAFHLLFQPSPPVANMIQERLQSAGLKRDMYAVAHSRVLYATSDLPEKERLRAQVVNAIHCASQLMPGAPIYFASDALEAKQQAQEYARQTNYSIATFTDLEPIHLEFASERSVQDYYPIFVDLYLLSYGQCISFGKGGYGKWTNLMSSNASCSSDHTSRTCTWKGV